MTTPHGSWPSPISAAATYAQSTGLGAARVDGPDVYWLESRSAEGGRSALVRRTADGGITDVAPAPFSARSRVHEYGGGAYAVSAGTVVLVDFGTQQVFRVETATDAATAMSQPVPITPATEGAAVRFGGLCLDPARRAVYAVREDHRPTDTGLVTEPVNTLVRLDLDGPNDDHGVVVVEGPDFVSAPSLSPDGRHLAWVQWDHPRMPWDGTELRVARLDAHGDPARDLHTAGLAGGHTEAIEEPVWLDTDRLVCVSDRTGWGNLYTLSLADPARGLAPILPMDRDFGGPRWMLDLRTMAPTGDGRLVATWSEDGFGVLGVLDPGTGDVTRLNTDATSHGDVVIQQGPDHRSPQVLSISTFADRPAALTRTPLDGGPVQTLRASSSTEVGRGFVSRPEPVSWSTPDGATAYGFFYPPTHPSADPPAGELAPLIVQSHGGPTGATVPAFSLSRLYWTSRGVAVLDVNYGGSTGYGRAYRERLHDRWGIVDVGDCVSGARHLAAAGRVDGDRMAITGGSAGGYTTLAALTFDDTFTAGASHFGVSDLAALAEQTHKFESRYLDGLVGPWPQARAVYEQRSPIHHVQRLSCPIILFQGATDKVVPPNQAQLMADAARAKGLPVAHLLFEGEGHGFRQLENLVRAREAETSFYAQVFGYTPAGEVPPVQIDNLPQTTTA